MPSPTGINVIVDGRPITVPKGTNAVDAAHAVGVEIPIFCHHPRLEPVGMCRMCLVEVGTPSVNRDTKEVERDADGNPVIKFFPKLQAGCTTVVSEGMVVRTVTPVVAEARKSVLEFLLTSHPLDCPVCDKGGECPLQNLTMRYGPGQSRFAWGQKFHFPKPIPIGPLILLDRERCVLCARCIRFQDEVADDPVLGFENRGRGMEIVSFSDPPFQSYFSGNTADICPVGALTTKDFRFQARAWEVVAKPGICTHCPVGCNLMHDVRNGHIERVMPRENNAVNEIWLCDKGRFAHHHAAAPDRLATPWVRRDGRLVEATWEEALDHVAAGLRAAQAAHGAAAIGGLTGTALANEDLYLFGRFMRSVVGTNSLDHRPAIVRDNTLVQAGAGAGTDLTRLAAGTTVLVVGLDVEEEAPVLFLNLFKGLRRGAKLVIVSGRPQKLDPHADATLRYSYGVETSLVAALINSVLTKHMPAKNGDAGGAPADSAPADGAPASATPAGAAPAGAAQADAAPAGAAQADAGPAGGVPAADVHVDGAPADSQRLSDLATSVAPFTAGALEGVHPVSAEALDSAASVIAGAENLIIVYGSEAASAGLVPALAALATATGHAGRPLNGLVAVGRHANAQGAADMGMLPDWLPGYRPVTDAAARAELAGHWLGQPPPEPGLDGAAMLAGGVRALYVAGTDPAGDDPRTAEALEKLDFLVVQELFMTPTAELADVVLPAQSAPEREGAFTNFTRRVQRFYAAVDPVGQSRPDWQILCELAMRMGAAMPFTSPADIMAEIARTVPGYAGLTYETLGPPPPPPPTSILLPFAPIADARYVSYEGTAYMNAYGEGAAWPLSTLERVLDMGAPAAFAGMGIHVHGADGDAPGKPSGNGAVPDQVNGAVKSNEAADGASPVEQHEAAEAVSPAIPTAGNAVPANDLLAWRPPALTKPVVGDAHLLLVPTARLYDAGTIARRSAILNPVVAMPFIEMSAFDARARGLVEGQQVRLSTEHGAVEATLRLRDGVTPGTVLAPESLAWAVPIRALCGGAPTCRVTIESMASTASNPPLPEVPRGLG